MCWAFAAKGGDGLFEGEVSHGGKTAKRVHTLMQGRQIELCYGSIQTSFVIGREALTVIL
jgi:hypothetical protein